MTTRLILDPPRFRKSFTHPPESFFFGSFLLSIAVIIGGIQLYGITLGPEVERKWLIPTIRILYWLYASVSLLNAIIQYWVFIQRTPARPIPMNPSWFLPIYSAMLTGTIASVIAPSQPPHHRLPIIISGIAYKGFGWTVAFVFIVLYIARLLEAGLPPPSLRPAMFIPVGSAAYTVVAFIGNARAIPRDYGYFATHPHAADSLQATALFFGVILWLVAFWLFALAVLSCFAGIKEMRFSSAWWAFIFPNVGFMLATAEIGREVESEGILWVASGMTGVVVIMWLVTVGACGKAVVEKRVLWPGRDEDKDM
jgi:tellurite resistance protein TehA-like permease